MFAVKSEHYIHSYANQAHLTLFLYVDLFLSATNLSHFQTNSLDNWTFKREKPQKTSINIDVVWPIRKIESVSIKYRIIILMWLRIFCRSVYSMYRKSENILAQHQWDNIKLLPFSFHFSNLNRPPFTKFFQNYKQISNAWYECGSIWFSTFIWFLPFIRLFHPPPLPLFSMSFGSITMVWWNWK